MAKTLIGICLLAVCALTDSGCSRDPEVRAAKFLESGKRYFDRKDYSRAIIQLNNARKLKPKDAEVWYQLGLAYLGSGDPRLARASFDKALEFNPRHQGAQLKRAGIALYGNSEEVKKAEEIARQLLKSSPGDPQASDVLAMAQFRLGRGEEAEQSLQEALKKFPEHVQSAFMLASLQVSRKDVSGAEATLRKIAEEAPKAPEPPVALAKIYAAQGKILEAEAQLQRALTIDGKFVPALADLATLKLRAGKKTEADEIYRRMSKLPDKRYRPVHARFLLSTGKRDEAVKELAALAKADPTDRDLRTFLAATYLSTGKRDEALKELEALAKADPKDRDMRKRLVATYLAVGRTADAEKVVAAALKQNPRDTDALLQRARLFMTAGKMTEAETDLTNVLGILKNSPEAHYLLARVMGARGETARRRQELDQALQSGAALQSDRARQSDPTRQSDPARQSDPTVLLARVELAQLLVSGRDAKAALEVLDQAPELQKRTPVLIAQRNWALFSLGNWAEARKGIDAGLALGPTPDLLLQDGLWKMQQQKDYAGARGSFEQALKANPEDIRALGALVDSYAAQKQLPAALARVRQQVAAQPASVRLRAFLGDLLLRSGNLNDARQAFESAKAVSKGNSAADLALAQIDVAQGKLDDARRRLKSVVAANDANIAARLLLGTVEERAANYPAAIEQYRRVVEKDSRNAVALNNLAFLLADHAQQPDEALRFAERAKEVQPDNAAIADTIGWVYYHKGLYGMAVQHLEKAAGSSGTTARQKYHLAMAYLKAGDQKRGRQMLYEARKLDANLPEAKAAQALLAEIVESER